MFDHEHNDSQPPRKVHPLEQRGNGYPNVRQPRQPRERMMLNMERITPFLSYALIAVNVAVFLVSVISPTTYREMVLAGANSGSGVFGEGQYYRLFTAMFLHANFAHIFFNMYALSILGTSIEQMYGRWRFAAIYMLGGLTGSVASAWLNDPNIIGVGASGAVFALLGAQFFFYYRYRKELGAMGRGAVQQYATILIINVLIGITVPQIDNTAHMGGLVGGVALGLLLAPQLTAKLGLDMMGGQVRVIHINPRSQSQTAMMLYALALIGWVIVLSFFLF